MGATQVLKKKTLASIMINTTKTSVKTDVNVMFDAKWSHHVDFDNLVYDMI
jgi:hypothetical protein